MNINDRQLKNAIIINIVVILYWMSTLIYRHTSKRELDKLKNPVIGPFCNGWCISHILYYIVIGYLSPEYWFHMTIIGILFEFFELLLSRLSLFGLNRYINSYLISDPIRNTIGLIIGLILFKLFPNTIDLYKLITFH